MASAPFTPESNRRTRFVLVVLLGLVFLAVVLMWRRGWPDRPPTISDSEPSRSVETRVAPAFVPVNPPTGLPASTTPASPASRMRLASFELDGNGLRLVESRIAPGRVKAPPFSVAAHRLEFTVSDRNGVVLYQGALPHPLDAVHESIGADGKMQGTVGQPAGAFLLRLPDLTGADRLAVYEVNGPTRTLLGSYPLQ